MEWIMPQYIIETCGEPSPQRGSTPLGETILEACRRRKSQMPGYQTDKLEKYPPNFQNVAEGLFPNAQPIDSTLSAKEISGSYSIFGTTSKETAAKIVIYHPHI
jgi:hypothetical protein